MIVYIWDDAENYWPSAPSDDAGNHANPFSHASGIDLFEAAHRHLEALQIRTPRICLAGTRDRASAKSP